MLNIVMLSDKAADFFAITYSVGWIIALLLMITVVFVFFVTIFKRFNLVFYKDSQYDIIEIACLNKMCKDIGIDLEKEKQNLDMITDNSFRRKVQKRLVEKYFNDDDKNEQKRKEKDQTKNIES